MFAYLVQHKMSRLTQGGKLYKINGKQGIRLSLPDR